MSLMQKYKSNEANVAWEFIRNIDLTFFTHTPISQQCLIGREEHFVV
jgi:hypothetical protein